MTKPSVPTQEIIPPQTKPRRPRSLTVGRTGQFKYNVDFANTVDLCAHVMEISRFEASDNGYWELSERRGVPITFNSHELVENTEWKAVYESNTSLKLTDLFKTFVGDYLSAIFFGHGLSFFVTYVSQENLTTDVVMVRVSLERSLRLALDRHGKLPASSDEQAAILRLIVTVVESPARLAALSNAVFSPRLLATGPSEQGSEPVVALPKKASELYEDRPISAATGKRETIVEFLRRVWKDPWIDAGVLDRPALRRLDGAAERAIQNWLRHDSLPEDVNVPTKKEQNDKILAAPTVPAGEELRIARMLESRRRRQTPSPR